MSAHEIAVCRPPVAHQVRLYCTGTGGVNANFALAQAEGEAGPGSEGAGGSRWPLHLATGSCDLSPVPLA